ncbi:Peroxyureidoacrylate/ureidoacrylate amidohydrolase RutB [Paraburkholderia domus]|uniref:isochorismatase family protein n=1 Tax=Paraburkholderia domus TaxID=2793075 RepID=UPI0019143E1E|nr:isochorismatase family protein [Paraburkholderia domus]MBK5091553.1 isochorismatase family protein [Burkholderia sp. R-69927]CAE6937409.1 Peroxyureidoacrylate/ureidoacrylate amidohydrolase RutB [Paraburkholderia domus]
MKRRLSIAPGNAAMLFIDLQEEHRCDERYVVAGFDIVLANVRDLQQAARTAGLPVLHAVYIVDSTAGQPRRFHPMMANGTSAFSDKTSPLSAICQGVGPIGREEIFVKDEASAFSNGRLAATLADLGVEWVFIAGVWTEACVDATVKDAIALGYRVMLVKDACGSGTVTMHQTGLLNLANRLYGGAVTDTNTACRVIAGEPGDVWMLDEPVQLRFTTSNIADLYDAL